VNARVFNTSLTTSFAFIHNGSKFQVPNFKDTYNFNQNQNFLKNTPSVSKYMSILENNFVSQYLSLSSFNATLIIALSIIPLHIYCRERENRMK